MDEKVGIDLYLSRSVRDRIDALVGKRKRSEYINQALEEHLRMLKASGTNRMPEVQADDNA